MTRAREPIDLDAYQRIARHADRRTRLDRRTRDRRTRGKRTPAPCAPTSRSASSSKRQRRCRRRCRCRAPRGPAAPPSSSASMPRSIATPLPMPMAQMPQPPQQPYMPPPRAAAAPPPIAAAVPQRERDADAARQLRSAADPPRPQLPQVAGFGKPQKPGLQPWILVVGALIMAALAFAHHARVHRLTAATRSRRVSSRLAVTPRQDTADAAAPCSLQCSFAVRSVRWRQEPQADTIDAATRADARQRRHGRVRTTGDAAVRAASTDPQPSAAAQESLAGDGRRRSTGPRRQRGRSPAVRRQIAREGSRRLVEVGRWIRDGDQRRPSTRRFRGVRRFRRKAVTKWREGARGG